LYELKRGEEVVATGRLSGDRRYLVGDRVEVAGWAGIVRDVLPIGESGEQRLLVQVQRGED